MSEGDTRGTRACRREPDGSAIYLVGENTPPTRLDLFLKERIPRLSRRRIQQAVRERVVVTGSGGARPATPATILRPGDAVVIRRAVPPEEEAPSVTLPLLHLDEALIAVDKPAGVLSHPSNRVQKLSVTWLLARQVDGPIHLVHRLDRETSGVLLAARTAGAARILSDQISRSREGATKRYLALVFGTIGPDEGEIDLPIGRAIRSAVYVKRGVNAEEGHAARTRFRVLSRAPGFSLVETILATGRRHQIRVHLAALGHPVVGDKLYGKTERHYLRFITGGFDDSMRRELLAERQMLHASALTVDHPRSGESLTIRSPLPRDFHECLGRLGVPPPPEG